MAYSDKVLDHYANPRNVGSFAKDEENVGTGIVGAPECGDVMKLQIQVDQDGRISSKRFLSAGLTLTLACSTSSVHSSKSSTPLLASIYSAKVLIARLNLIG